MGPYREGNTFSLIPSVLGFLSDLSKGIEFESLNLTSYEGLNLFGYDLLFTDLKVVAISKPQCDTMSQNLLDSTSQSNKIDKIESLRLLGNSFLWRKSYCRGLQRYLQVELE